MRLRMIPRDRADDCRPERPPLLPGGGAGIRATGARRATGRRRRSKASRIGGTRLETRGRLEELLAEQPPSLVQVLRLDPMLLTNTAHLAPYPDLAAFLAQHPEIAVNPRFYVGDARASGPEYSRTQTINAIEEMGAGIGVFLFFMTALGVVTHVGRSILEHRRWLQATKVQTDAHAKLVDRLASNEDLMAYVQSPAGQRFLSATLAVGDETRAPAAPIGRILTSTQIGVVGAFAGLGLWVAKGNVIEDVAQPLQVIATLAIALWRRFRDLGGDLVRPLAPARLDSDAVLKCVT